MITSSVLYKEAESRSIVFVGDGGRGLFGPCRCNTSGGGGGALGTLHKARTDQPIDILQEKTLRKCDDCVGEKILSRFRPSTLFLYGNL